MLVVFDLDFTLWDCGGTWCDHTNPPFYKHNGVILDEDRRIIELYPDVIRILEEVKKRDLKMAVASRTSAPDWAHELMEMFDVKKFFDFFEVYPGSKINHFRSLQESTSLPFHNMIFFDDEMRNIQEVESLGVKAIYVESGINIQMVKKHISFGMHY